MIKYDYYLKNLIPYVETTVVCNNCKHELIADENYHPRFCDMCGAPIKDNLSKVKVCVPPLTEQHQIATYLDEKCSDIDSLIAIKQQKIEELKDYKKSLIYEYVTGKKQVGGLCRQSK